MKSIVNLGVAIAAFCIPLVQATPLQAVPLEVTAPLEKKQSCTNGPTSRNCWLPGFDSNTNMYEKWPDTGRIVRKDLTITNTTCNPDGNGERVCLLVDGSLPGPTIIGDWGDIFEITVRNQMQHNGTSIHWHGLRQLNSNTEDGVNGVTECALAPGDSKTYRFRATEYGTTWYHSHFSAQLGDGTLGTIIINGPATANYDIDLGTYTVQDWYYPTAYQAAARAVQSGPQQADNILINGTNKNSAGTTGSFSEVKLQGGKAHRLRLVNTAFDVAIRVSLDDHAFTVISEDFVPVKPYTTNYILLGIGQRYDVVVNANATAGNYWFRANPEASCFSFVRNANNARAIFSYDNVTIADPTTTAHPNPPTACEDPKSTPNIARDVPSAAFASEAQTLPITFGNTTVATNNESLVLWTVNGSSMIIDPAEPTLEYLSKNNHSFPPNYNLIDVSPTASWTFWVIQQIIDAVTPPIPHPIHLHGHDMFILGTGQGEFNVNQHFSQLTFQNPPRRDVHHLPASGWMVIAFPTDNPGAWLMHCHIAFHVAEGLSVQFLENADRITMPAQNSEWFNTCRNYENYIRNKPVYPQDDSGLKKRWPPTGQDLAYYKSL